LLNFWQGKKQGKTGFRMVIVAKNGIIIYAIFVKPG
jgi:hypothetical protein